MVGGILAWMEHSWYIDAFVCWLDWPVSEESTQEEKNGRGRDGL